jgi:mRNA interferase RelE/StbE
MNLEISYSKKSDKFIIKNKNVAKNKITQLVANAVKKIILKQDINIDLKKLQGNLKNYYRIRHGKIRILFEITNQQVIIQILVYDIDFRGNIYK